MSEWQPIATCPKDGTRILFGHWFADDGLWFWQSSGCIEDDRFWIDVQDDFIVSANFETVTHWMPLPAPSVAP